MRRHWKCRVAPGYGRGGVHRHGRVGSSRDSSHFHRGVLSGVGVTDPGSPPVIFDNSRRPRCDRDLVTARSARWGLRSVVRCRRWPRDRRREAASGSTYRRKRAEQCLVVTKGTPRSSAVQNNSGEVLEALVSKRDWGGESNDPIAVV